MGKMSLPDDPDERREFFNNALVQLAKQLPPTNPGIETREYSCDAQDCLS